MRDLLWQSDAWKEYVEIQTDKALLKKINQFEFKKDLQLLPAGLNFYEWFG